MKFILFLLILGLLWTTPVSAQSVDLDTIQKTWTNSISTYMPFLSPIVVKIGERVAGFFGKKLEEEKARIHREIQKEKQELINDFNKYTGNFLQHIFSQILKELPFDKLKDIQPKELISDQLEGLKLKDLISP